MGRVYTHKKTGRKYPSVTTVIPDGFAGVPDDLLEDARERGNWVHDATVLIDHGALDWPSVPDAYEPYCRAYEELRGMLNFRPFPEFTERSMSHDLFGVAGKVDRVGQFIIEGKIPSRPIIPDIKTGDSAPKKSKALWGLQTAGYQILVENQEDKPKGKFDRWIFQLRSDGTYRTYPMTEPSDRAAFLSFLSTYNWKAIHGLVDVFT